MKCELGCDYDCLDLPSLTEIQCNGHCDYSHEYMRHVILESMV